MSIWLAGLLAVLIVVGGLVTLVLFAASVSWLEDAIPRTLRKIAEWFFIVFVVLCALGTLAGLWYIVLSWLMGWPL